MGPGENGVALGADRLQAKIPKDRIKTNNQRLRGLSFFIAHIEKEFHLAET
jgi:hypothetical protein